MHLPPRLSVVIPHLNDHDGLARCLSALDAQRADGVSFEVIVVDNGSRVSPEAVCARFPHIRLAVERMPGPGPARNRGASMASAPLIAFIDADCVAAPGWIRAIADHMEQNPSVDFIGGDIRIRCADPQHMTAVEAFESIYSYRARHYVEQLGFSATGNMAVRKSVFEAVGPFGGIATMEDTEWGQRASGMGYRVVFLERALVRTPSCKSFEELTRRWDRHIAHEFAQFQRRSLGRLRWLALAAVLAASPAGEIPKIVRTDRLSGIRARLMAFGCMARVRLYRASRMVGLALHDTSSTVVVSWNREGH